MFMSFVLLFELCSNEFLPEPESVTPSVLGVHLNKVQTKGQKQSSSEQSSDKRTKAEFI